MNLVISSKKELEYLKMMDKVTNKKQEIWAYLCKRDGYLLASDSKRLMILETKNFSLDQLPDGCYQLIGKMIVPFDVRHIFPDISSFLNAQCQQYTFLGKDLRISQTLFAISKVFDRPVGIETLDFLSKDFLYDFAMYKSQSSETQFYLKSESFPYLTYIASTYKEIEEKHIVYPDTIEKNETA